MTRPAEKDVEKALRGLLDLVFGALAVWRKMHPVIPKPVGPPISGLQRFSDEQLDHALSLTSQGRREY